MRRNIGNIISESINRFMREDSAPRRTTIDEAVSTTIDRFLVNEKQANRRYADRINHKSTKYRNKKLAGGRTIAYDYDQEMKDNPHVTDSDANSLINKIDDEYLNVAAVARSIFPDHTEEGAQSQLRKIMNGDRPMTTKTAKKIRKKISAGEIPSK